MYTDVYTYHCTWVDLSGHLYICKDGLSGDFVRLESPLHAHIVARASVLVLWGVVVSIHQARHQELAGNIDIQYTYVYSGTPLIWIPLGHESILIKGVSSFQWSVK